METIPCQMFAIGLMVVQDFTVPKLSQHEGSYIHLITMLT